jgi:hypothetical protein
MILVAAEGGERVYRVADVLAKIPCLFSKLPTQTLCLCLLFTGVRSGSFFLNMWKDWESYYSKWRFLIQNVEGISLIIHGAGPRVDPFQSHVSRNLFKGLPWFLLPVGLQCFITLGNLLRGVLFIHCIQFSLYSNNLSKIGVNFQLLCNFCICSVVRRQTKPYPTQQSPSHSRSVTWSHKRGHDDRVTAV